MRRQQRRVNRRFLVVCEGDTELNYAKALKQTIPRDQQRGIQIEVQRAGHRTSAADLLKFAVRLKRKASQDHNPYDQIWILCDHDHDPNLQDVFTTAHKQGILIGFTCPCIEYWFLLHFRDIRQPFANCEEAYRRLLREWPEYQKTGQNHVQILHDRLPMALERADRLRDQADPELNIWDQNPVSTIQDFIRWMHSLT